LSSGPEWELVERPLLALLASLGWETLVWGDQQPGDHCERGSERDVLLEQRLRPALRHINLGPEGVEWLEEPRINSAVAELRSMHPGMKLIEANKRSTELLLGGVTVPGLEGWDGGRDQTIKYIDWDNWEANDFLAVSQFRVATPGQAKDIRPDVTLFVNGIPLVVIEAKPPGKESGITDAIDQLRRYANQRGSAVAEGSEQLFWTNQFTVATTGERAEAGTFSALPEHYLAWKDPYPVTIGELAASLGKLPGQLTQQETLTAGMLAPQRLLDIVRHFTLFMQLDSGPAIKVVCRYQQYRGVTKALERMTTGKTKAVDGHVDRRGGIVWHTQGSGKSLTMVFLIRAMRSHPELRRFKIVLVTDRVDLQRQLRDTVGLAGETVKVARNAGQVRQLLSQPGPGVVMAMIQKYRDTKGGESDGLGGDESFGVLNDSESILVMVDEAHRSHTTKLHANLMAALPNAARIGFTGTPIIMGERKKTIEIFGGYLDQYTLLQSEADGSTVPIYYEGRVTDGAVKGASTMDELFFRWFSGLIDAQRHQLQAKYVTTAQVLEAPEMIAAKARDILRQYVSTVMPGGFKGILVATSREACVRYFDALNAARDELTAEIEQRAPQVVAKATSYVDLSADERFIFDAAERLDLIRALEFAPTISGDHNDPPSYHPWTDKGQQEARIQRFKRPLGPMGEKTDPLAILIVKSMLLTGFDAPGAQVLYLDRMIQEAELLQAIARVNRTASKKSYGLVVDYYGVSSQLTRALAAYTSADGQIDPDVEGALRPLSTEIAKLGPQCERIRQIFFSRGITPLPIRDTIEECVELLADERLRAEFDVALAAFLNTFDIVLPRPEALPFSASVTLFGEIQIQARRRYRDTVDGDFDPHKYKEKVRSLINQHVTVLDLSRKIAPMRITDPDFTAYVRGLTSDRAKASEMEHAVRYHIRERGDDDPAYFRRLSERVDEILDRLEENWEQIALELKEVIQEINAGRADTDKTGLDPKSELPFHGVLAEKVASSDAEVSDRLIALTRSLVANIRQQIGVVGFWQNTTKQDDLRKSVKRSLDDSDLFAYDALDALAVEVVELAKAKQRHLS
jgi:type I restriction enzyme R subunit